MTSNEAREQSKKYLFAYQHFLFLNHLANKMVGHKYLNFAKLCEEEDNGQFMNSQMTSYFYVLDKEISELQMNDTLWMYEYIDKEVVAKIEPFHLMEDYDTYCLEEGIGLIWDNK